jgi:competence protein ComEA
VSRSDEQDELVRRRLIDLGLHRPGWVPEQPDLQPAAPAPAPAPMAPVARTDLAGRFRELELTASGRALAGLAAVCVALLLVTAWALMRPHRPPAVPPTAPLPVAALPSPTPSGIVVDVGGRVRRPGLVTVPLGSRVADALRAAGGPLRPSDLALLNLAAKVTDGQLLLIGVSGAGAIGADPTSGSSGPVDLNSATADQLDALPGIGPVLAQRIIDWRTAHGAFRSVRDLDQVSGIGDSIYAELEPLVTV